MPGYYLGPKTPNGRKDDTCAQIRELSDPLKTRVKILYDVIWSHRMLHVVPQIIVLVLGIIGALMLLSFISGTMNQIIYLLAFGVVVLFTGMRIPKIKLIRIQKQKLEQEIKSLVFCDGGHEVLETLAGMNWLVYRYAKDKKYSLSIFSEYGKEF